uniref:RNA-directed DNA polymerase, eukaryota, reverse transcriptase zinc-binding domain protein n=1 Tax=Tanacetum cinerariifolium TaxID=118510 RepID=A0A6L2J9X7_TANCI|nr:RNA-directed DNA polymerase, eukaryota, reverse transcriptase zinc-binding domain protein [Tanacetum cinerariifolium]
MSNKKRLSKRKPKLPNRFNDHIMSNSSQNSNDSYDIENVEEIMVSKEDMMDEIRENSKVNEKGGLGWNIEVVDVMVVQSCSQTILCLVETIKTKEAWTLMGDFNVTLNIEEHSNGTSNLTNDMSEFKDTINSLEVEDLCSTGFYYTWTKSLKNPHCRTLKKLDRIMVNDEFLNKFINAIGVFLPYPVSDHNPAIMKIPKGIVKKRKSFRFANYVADKDDFLDLVKKGWVKNVRRCQMHIQDNILITQELLKGYNRKIGAKRSLEVVKKTLNDFSSVSGLFPNLSKSTIFFGRINGKLKEDLLQILTFKCEKLPMKFLGVPRIAKRLGELMKIRDKIKPYVMFKIVDGKTISLWHEKWCDQGPLDRFVHNRDIYDARMSSSDCLADAIEEDVPSDSTGSQMALGGSALLFEM